MPIFSSIFFKIISILLSIIVGYFAGRFKKVDRETIANLIFYFIAPIVFFSVPASSNITFADLGIVFIVYFISSCLAIFSYYFYSKYWQDNTYNIIAMSSGTGNVGYFMLPIASMLFDFNTLSIYMLGVIGMNIYESSLGYYLCARSISSTKESIIRVLKLPLFHAFLSGCLLSLIGVRLPNFLGDFIFNMKITYSILGMLMVGLGISQLERFVVDYKFTAHMFLSKYIFCPLFYIVFVFLDKFILGIYSSSEYQALILLSSAPLAANSIVISSILKLQPERVATTVLISSVFSLIFIPLTAIMILKFLG